MANYQHLMNGNSAKMEELKNLVREDCQLPADICLADNIKPEKKFCEIQTVLLIGVTGMMGPYLLRDICTRPQIKKVYCLMRKTKQEMSDRMRKRLEATGVIQEIDFSKIICINGDICLENLGMSVEEYEALSEKIEGVVHFGVKACYTGEYSREPGKDGIRTVNIIGTTNVLKFVVNKTLKCFFLASSLFCSFISLASDRFSEDWQDPGTFDDAAFNNGYRISKFISEQLCKQAIELGVPVKVFRFGMFGGESKTGYCDYKTNQYSLGLLTFLKLGYVPELPFTPVILPVDVYSKLSVQVFFNAEAPPDVYNVCKSRFPTAKKIFNTEHDFNFKVKLVSIRKFAGKVKKARIETLPLASFLNFYLTQDENGLNEVLTSRSFKGAMKLLKERDVVFENFKMAKYVPNIDYVDCTEDCIKRDVKFLMESGAFEKYGVN